MCEQALKKHKAQGEPTSRCDWRTTPYSSDWTLYWDDDFVGHVHRVILVHGARPAHFFRGAFNEGFAAAASSDLSKVLPTACRKVLEIALDFTIAVNLNQNQKN